MKSFLKNSFGFIFVVMFLAVSMYAAPKNDINTQVASIDQHGNVILAVKSNSLSPRGFGTGDLVNVKVDNYKFVCPIVKSYSDVNNGEFLVRIYDEEVLLAINMGNFTEKTGAKIGSPVTISMKEKRGYLTTFQLRSLKLDHDRNNFPSDEVFANFRSVENVGKIAKNRLYRSVSPLSENANAAYAAKLMEKYGVNLVLDLADDQDYIAEKVKTIPYYDNLVKEGRVIFLGVGSSLSDETFNAKFRDGLIFIAEHPGCTYYIHGQDGKNRTGYVISVLGSLCGATIEEESNEYMKSFENLYGVKKGTQQYDEIAKSIPYMFANLSGGKKVTDKNLQKLAEQYLISTLGLTQEQVDSIRKNLTE